MTVNAHPATPAAADLSGRGFVWHNLPARYAHPQRWARLGPLPRPEPDSHAERVLSDWLLQAYAIHTPTETFGLGPTPALPDWVWLREADLHRLAHRIGLACVARRVALTIDRLSCQQAQAQLGDSGWQDALQLHLRFPALAASQAGPDQSLGAEHLQTLGRLHLADQLSAVGSDGDLARFELRWPPGSHAPTPASALSPTALIELQRLLQESVPDASPCPSFDWRWPRWPGSPAQAQTLPHLKESFA